MKYTFTVIYLLFAIIGVEAQTWVKLSNYKGFAVDDAVGFSIGTKAYVGTGTTDWWANQRDFYVFDVNLNTWVEIASLPFEKERQYATGFTNDSLGFVFGGVNGSTFFNDLWSYHPPTDSWTEMTSLPGHGRSGAANFVINDTAYIIGGKTDSLFAIDEVWA
ncbi:MAG: hypothetical protein N4A46_08400, partial [Schleiferiaceae bacterium]|nr:hypothetical protein [Schleiferiaceae bacterium]